MSSGRSRRGAPAPSGSSNPRKRKAKNPAAPAKKNPKRRLDFDHDDEPGELDTLTTLTSLLSSKCHVESCSPLYTGATPAEFSRISRRLEHELPELISGDAIHSFRVRIFKLQDIKSSELDSESLYLEIIQHTYDEFGDRPVSRKVIFKGLFTSCNSVGTQVKSSAFRNQTSNETKQNLPVLIWNGGNPLWKHLKPLLEKTFKCNILPFNFITFHMQAFGLLWMQQKAKLEHSTFILKIEHEYPRGGTLNSKPNAIHIALIDFLNFMDRIEELGNLTSSNFLTCSKEIRNLWREVIDKYSEHSGTNFRQAVYITLASKDCIISKDGLIKLMRKSTMEEILPVLINLTRFVEAGIGKKV